MDRLFDGFRPHEVQGYFQMAARAADVIAAHTSDAVNFTVMCDQQLHLRTEGVAVIISHRVGDDLKVRVHHNTAYPGRRELAETIARELGTEVS